MSANEGHPRQITPIRDVSTVRASQQPAPCVANHFPGDMPSVQGFTAPTPPETAPAGDPAFEAGVDEFRGAVEMYRTQGGNLRDVTATRKALLARHVAVVRELDKGRIDCNALIATVATLEARLEAQVQADSEELRRAVMRNEETKRDLAAAEARLSALTEAARVADSALKHAQKERSIFAVADWLDKARAALGSPAGHDHA